MVSPRYQSNRLQSSPSSEIYQRTLPSARLLLMCAFLKFLSYFYVHSIAMDTCARDFGVPLGSALHLISARQRCHVSLSVHLQVGPSMGNIFLWNPCLITVPLRFPAEMLLRLDWNPRLPMYTFSLSFISWPILPIVNWNGLQPLVWFRIFEWQPNIWLQLRWPRCQVEWGLLKRPRRFRHDGFSVFQYTGTDFCVLSCQVQVMYL